MEKKRILFPCLAFDDEDPYDDDGACADFLIYEDEYRV